jgi:hypothetical protein
MKKYFLYELKKARWELIILTVIFTLLCGTVAAVSPMQTKYEHYNGYGEWVTSVWIETPVITLAIGLLALMCYAAPAGVYAFKMNKRSVDCYYALPIKKEKLYFIKALIGLLLVAIPFTVAYWTTFFVYLIRPNNPYEMGWFVPTYFGLLFFALCLFGYNAFAFTRGNSMQDGITFMVAYSLVLLCVALVPFLWSEGKLFSWQVLLGFWPGYGGIMFSGNMIERIMGADGVYLLSTDLKLDALTFIMPALQGAAGYGLLFVLLRKDKAEDSQQVCESWFGYKTLIPIFTAVAIGLLVGSLIEVDWAVALIVFVMCAVAAFVSIIVWRRKFLFGKTGWIVLGVGLGAAIVIAFITTLIFNPYINGW